MATSMELVWVSRDNRIDLRLKADLNDGAGMLYRDLAAVTKMEVLVGGVTVASTNGGADVIRWAQSGYALGEVRMWLGKYTYPVGNPPVQTPLPTVRCDAPLIVTDPSNLSGIVWGFIPMQVAVAKSK